MNNELNLFISRWWNTELWSQFFLAFLNIPSADELPDLSAWREKFQEFFFAKKLSSFNAVANNISLAMDR